MPEVASRKHQPQHLTGQLSAESALHLSSTQPPQGPAFQQASFSLTPRDQSCPSLLLFRQLFLAFLCSPWPCSGLAEARSQHCLTASLPPPPTAHALQGAALLGEKLPSLKVLVEWAEGPLSQQGWGEGWPLICWPLWQKGDCLCWIPGSTLKVPLPVSLGPIPTSPCFPAALRSFPDLWAHVAGFLTSSLEPQQPAEPRARPCPLPCPLFTPRPGLSSGAGKWVGIRQQREAWAFGAQPGTAGVDRGCG